MRWPIVLVIFRREVRDQLRDRRTLFMIFVLPILLYPMLGIGVLKFTEAFEQKPRTVVLVGRENLPEEPPLLDRTNDRFSPGLFDTEAEATRLVVRVEPAEGRWLDPEFRRQVIRTNQADAVVTVPPDFRRRVERKEDFPLEIDYDSADEKSQITYLRLKEVLSRWKEGIVNRRLKQDRLPPSYTEPFKIHAVDVATAAEAGGTVWAKLFPFLLVMMSLTGAFYPAVDLCAGEKERGTMETLLISPASRAEIVVGKFLTVMLASVMTAMLNLVSMGLTGSQLARGLGAAAAAGGRFERIAAALSPPSMESAVWIVLLLVPLAAFFSAVCLALAVLARSMKEGQYYMTPLYLVCLPLIFLTLVPGIEINLFYSLIPVTGVSLLLRALLLGDYAVAGQHFLPVLMTTVAYGGVALRWAIDQFQREDVIFREAERFDLRAWVRHLLRDKEPTPTGGEALLCFAVMLTLAWFLTQYLVFSGLATTTSGMAAGQVGFILTPPLAMALLLTSSPRRTLRLYWPRPRYLALAVGLALALNPLVNELRPVVERLFPISNEVKAALEQMMEGVPGLGTALVLFAVIPAVCEELAFRGFILSGLERGHTTRTAIVLSAVLFGFMHVLLSLFQQLFNATLLGLVLGLLAVRSRSIVPGVVFHMINNGLAVLTGFWVATAAGRRFAGWVYREPAQGLYHWGLVAVGLVASVVLLALLAREAGAKANPGPGSTSADLGELVPAGGSAADD
jgi:sodium transport system permease protein